MKIQFNFRNCNSTGKTAGSKKKYYSSDKKNVIVHRQLPENVSVHSHILFSILRLIFDVDISDVLIPTKPSEYVQEQRPNASFILTLYDINSY